MSSYSLWTIPLSSEGSLSQLTNPQYYDTLCQHTSMLPRLIQVKITDGAIDRVIHWPIMPVAVSFIYHISKLSQSQSAKYVLVITCHHGVTTIGVALVRGQLDYI
jgi:hypothetical protein